MVSFEHVCHVCKIQSVFNVSDLVLLSSYCLCVSVGICVSVSEAESMLVSVCLAGVEQLFQVKRLQWNRARVVLDLLSVLGG